MITLKNSKGEGFDICAPGEHLHSHFWINRLDGEGMSFDVDELVAVLDKWFTERF